MKTNLEIWAHRGLHNASTPENSLESIRAAIDSGVKRIEIDVWLHEGELVLTHDSPTTGHPLLKDALKIIDGKSEIYLELKHKPSAKEAHTLIEHSYQNHSQKVIFASFDVDALRVVRKKSSSARLGLNYRGIDNFFLDIAEELKVEYIGMNWKRVIPNYFNLKQARSLLGVKVLAYTVNLPCIARLMSLLKVTGVFTDKPKTFNERN